jgi:alkanesulfonate monooxygenase SsuD/methylene tetrahydromethanopterin reductase-like flavin-dependent oxidoreductase (luciferase family)
MGEKGTPVLIAGSSRRAANKVRTRENATETPLQPRRRDLRKLPSQLVTPRETTEAANQKAEAVMSHRAPSPTSWGGRSLVSQPSTQSVFLLPSRPARRAGVDGVWSPDHPPSR